jgi:hypothetical protein
MALTQVTPDVLHNIQSNVTQVGTLSNLTVTGNVVAGNLNLNAGLATARMSMITNSGTGNFTYNTSLGYSWFESGNDSTSPAMRLQSGSLGIGTFDPGYRLHVVQPVGDLTVAFQSQVGQDVLVRLNNQSVHYAFWGSDNATGSAFYANSSANACVFGTTTTNNIQFVTNFNERVRILGSTGNVGINTANPTERLHVVGNVIVTGNVTAPNFSGTANNASFLGGIPAANFANIAAFANSLTTPGWQRLPGGLIIQWFSTSENSTQGSFTVNYPIAFPTAFLAASCSTTNTTNSSNSDLYIQFVSSTTTAITLYRQAVNNFASIGAMVIALGY